MTMKTARLVALASVVLAAGAAAVPDHASADGRRGGGGFRGGSSQLHSSPPKFFPNRGFHHHHHRFNRFGPGFGFGGGSTVVIYSAPASVDPTPAYAAPTYAYTPPPAYAPPAYAPAPAYAPPTQTVVEFPTGRYELRGDGVTTPYRWVWIPNPPVSPPGDAAPVVPPPGPTGREPARNLDFYRWTDDQGVVHFSDRLDKVPDAYRQQVKKSHS